MSNKKSEAVIKIENTFIQFMKEGVYPFLTVKQLIDRAGVGKSTFYRNYHDVYDVFEHLLNDFIDKVMTVVDALLINTELFEGFKILFDGDEMLFGNLPFDEKDEILVKYSLETTDSVVISSFMLKIDEKLQQLCVKSGLSPIQAQVISRFAVGAVVSGCLRNYADKKVIDLHECKYAFKTGEDLLKRRLKND